MSYDLTSTVDVDLLFPSHLMSRLLDKQVQSVTEIPGGERGIGWFVIIDIIKKKTKNNKAFYRFKVMDNNSQTTWVRVWGEFEKDPEKYTLWMAQVANDANWGLSTSVDKVKRIA